MVVDVILVGLMVVVIEIAVGGSRTKDTMTEECIGDCPRQEWQI